jgi:hypothetical protein
MNLTKHLAGLLAVAASFSVTLGATAAPILSEGFNDISTLPANGWVLVNNSSPPGLSDWFQGNPAIFPAAAGPADSYIAASHTNAAFGGAVSNWLLTPELALSNGESMNFSLRLLGEGFLDRVEVYFSTAGASADVGATETSTGDFTFLTAFDSTVDTGWLNQAVTLSGLTGPASGRFAFRYVVDDTSIAGDYAGIDSVVVNAAAIPEPGSIALIALGIGAMIHARRRRPVRWLAFAGASLTAMTTMTAQAAEPQTSANGLMTFPNVTVVAQPPVEKGAPAAPSDGLKAYRDPVTGKLTSPTPEQAAALDAAARAAAPRAKARVASPQTFRPGHGGVGIKLDSTRASFGVGAKASAKQDTTGDKK